MSDDDDAPPDLAALLDEIPRLARVSQFARSLNELRLFARVTEPLNAGELALARRYVSDLGFPDVEPAQLLSWSEAADAALSLDHDAAAWDAEELLRAGLTADARDLVDEEALTTVTTFVAERMAAVAQAGIDEILSLYDIDDEGILQAAMGGAIQAAHAAALALLIADDETPSATDEDAGGQGAGAQVAGPETVDHPAILRFRLFARGRWPIGVAGLTFNIL